MKFREDSSRGFQVTERTRFVTDRWTDAREKTICLPTLRGRHNKRVHKRIGFLLPMHYTVYIRKIMKNTQFSLYLINSLVTLTEINTVVTKSSSTDSTYVYTFGKKLRNTSCVSRVNFKFFIHSKKCFIGTFQLVNICSIQSCLCIK